jgi:hypothetical protein
MQPRQGIAISVTSGRAPFLIISTLVCTALAARAQAQRLETGSGDALQTVSLQVSVPVPSVAPVLSFDVGFATAETPAPGVFLDALTFTLQRADQTQTAVLLTVDAFGLKLAPPSAGAFQVNSDAINATSIAYFGSLSDPAERSAYHVTLDLPGEFAGAGQLLMDLFDNGDAKKSVGIVANVSIVSAPEPGVLGIVVAGGLLMCLWRRR